MKRAERERLHAKGGQETPPVITSELPFDTISDPDRAGFRKTNSPVNPVERFKIVAISAALQKKLIAKIDPGVIRDIFKYKYFLLMSAPIEFQKIIVLRHGGAYSYNFFCNSNIRLSILLNRSGDFVSLDASPQAPLSGQQKKPSKSNIFNSDEANATCAKILKDLFKNFDFEAVESILRDFLSIAPHRQISCEGGDLTVVNGQLAYRFTLSCGIDFCLFLDAIGNFIDLAFSKDPNDWRELLQRHSNQNYRSELNLFDTQA